MTGQHGGKEMYQEFARRPQCFSARRLALGVTFSPTSGELGLDNLRLSSRTTVIGYGSGSPDTYARTYSAAADAVIGGVSERIGK